MKYKKAQQSRSDMFVWYVVSMIMVFVVMGSMYGLGAFGEDHTSLIGSNEVTGAAIAVPKESNDQDEENNLEINSSRDDNG